MNPLLALIDLEKKIKSVPALTRWPEKIWRFSESGEAVRVWRQWAASILMISTAAQSANGHKRRSEGQIRNVKRREVIVVSRVGA